MECIERIERITSGEDIIDEFNDVQYIIEKGEEYYDNWGMSLSFGVLKNNIIVLSSKHWLRNCYIEVQSQTNDKIDKFVFGLWDVVVQTSRNVKRELQRKEGETKYVFISNLNRTQTTKVYQAIIEELNCRKLDFDIVCKTNIFGWDINDINAVRIPWVVGDNE